MARHFELAWDVTLPNGRRYRKGAVEIADEDGNLLALAKGVKELDGAPPDEPAADEEVDAAPTPDELKGDHSKATLLAMAEDLEVEGADRMNKAELAAAIVEARAGEGE